LQPFNLLRYNLDQKYDSHYDTFDPKEYGAQYSQRIATVLLYMSGVCVWGGGRAGRAAPGQLASCWR
jgi:prolyl 4-hydroxylase